MIQPKLDNTTAFNQQVRRYVLADSQGTTEIVFFPQALGVEPSELPRGPQLTYHGSEGQLTFTGDEIEQQQSPLGFLVTVAHSHEIGTRFSPKSAPPLTKLRQGSNPLVDSTLTSRSP